MLRSNFTPVEQVGELLMKMRKARKISQAKLGKAACLSKVTLSKLENGQIDQPKKETLQEIIRVLHDVEEISMVDRKIILGVFGFSEGSTLPCAKDIDNAIRVWQPLKSSKYPAYLIDFANRIHDWNEPALRLIGLSSNSDELAGLTVFDLAFGEELQRLNTGIKLTNRKEFLSILTRDIKSEYRDYATEEWCISCVDRAKQKYPEFELLWNEIVDEELDDFETRVLEPIHLSARGYGALKFKIVGTDVTVDHRFRAVKYEPLDKVTGDKCFALFKGI